MVHTGRIDGLLQRAVRDADVPFVVAMSANASGITYTGAAGQAAPGQSAGERTVFRGFSTVKAISATAAFILIERGKLDLDATVETYLPEFSRVEAIDHFENGEPILRKPLRKPTIRQLATHTSGLACATWNENVSRYQAATGAVNF